MRNEGSATLIYNCSAKAEINPPISCNTEVTFTLVCMTDDIRAMKRGDNYAFVPGFDYVKENGRYSESVGVFYEETDVKLSVKEERWTRII